MRCEPQRGALPVSPVVDRPHRLAHVKAQSQLAGDLEVGGRQTNVLGRRPHVEQASLQTGTGVDGRCPGSCKEQLHGLVGSNLLSDALLRDSVIGNLCLGRRSATLLA